ncbi:DUF4274 domain-containing protein [Cellulophaga baltica]|uniref:DUF4274 domain-containing protein n=1 Tax=Cellulophaga baltica TaxID=76594 RepID=UPI000401256C|nr:DUF4274 domain-containing protein [Cellulophaga baltica]
MELLENTISFIKQLGKKYNCTEEEAFSILSKENYGQSSAEFDNGAIVALNIPQLSSLFKKLSLNKSSMDSLEYLETKPSSKNLSPIEIDTSELHELTRLYFKSIEKVESKTELYSFRENPKLKEIDIQGYNVKSLDLKSNKDLIDLNCPGNELIELDLTENEKLEKLNCQFNQIRQLDLSKNNKLKYLLIRYLPVKTNDIQFPTINKIEELYIDETEISTINLNKFQNLRKLKIGEKIESIDVSPCKSLDSLSLIRTKLESLDISECPNLWNFSMWEGEIEKLTCNEFQSFIIPKIKKKLKQKASSAQINIIKTYQQHLEALSHNWDEGFSKLKKILKDENCDKATAIAIFWMGQPNYYLQFKKISEVPDHAKEGFRFLNKLEKQLMDDFFQVNVISFNPKNYQNNDWTMDSYDPAKVQREINDKLKKEIVGIGTKEFDFTRKITMKYS